MTAPSRQVARAARRNADQQQAMLTAAAGSGGFYATVTAVSPGASRDGLALVTIRYRGVDFTVSSYNPAYTPAVNDRVACLPIGGSQPYIVGASVGYP